MLAFVAGGAAGALLSGAVGRRGATDLHAQLARDPSFLADNPDLIESARAVLQTRRLEAQAGGRAQLIETRWKSFLHPAFTPGIGAESSARLLLEFTDYDCAPCKASAASVQQFLRAHSDTRLVLLYLPTNGAMAEFAARVAIAAYRQPGDFAQLHERLMNLRGMPSEESIRQAAQQAGFDTDALFEATGRADVRAHLAQVRALAADLDVPGVPAFLIGGNIIVGGIDRAQLEALAARPSAADGKPAKAAERI